MHLSHLLNSWPLIESDRDGNDGLALVTMAELHEQRDDGVENDALGGQELAHVENKLFGGHAFTFLILFLKRRNRQLPLSGGFHEGVYVGVVHHGTHTSRSICKSC